MLTAKKIENEAANYFSKNDEEKNIILNLVHDENALYEYFIKKVKEGDYKSVSYILNNCFDTAAARANFGNRVDDKGNSAYHYAAKYNHKEIIIILNDKHAYKGEKKLFRFPIKNKKGLTPLDVCCKNGHAESFDLMWPRVGKPQHNPLHSLPYACEGGNLHIIKQLVGHPKFKQSPPLVAEVLLKAKNSEYGLEVQSYFDFLNGQESRDDSSSSSRHKTSASGTHSTLFTKPKQIYKKGKDEDSCEKIEGDQPTSLLDDTTERIRFYKSKKRKLQEVPTTDDSSSAPPPKRKRSSM